MTPIKFKSERYSDVYEAVQVSSDEYRFKEGISRYSIDTYENYLPKELGMIDFPGGPFISIGYEFPIDRRKIVESITATFEGNTLLYVTIKTRKKNVTESPESTVEGD